MEDQRLKNEIKKVREAYTGLESQLNASTTKSNKLMEQNKSLNLKLKENQVLIEGSENNKKLKQDISESQNHHTTKSTTIQNQSIQLQKNYEDAQDRNEQYAKENAELNHCLMNANREVEEKSPTITRLKNQLEETTLNMDKLNQSVENLTLELDQDLQNRDTLVETSQRNKTPVAAKEVLEENLIEPLQENDSLQTKSSGNDEQIREPQNNLNTVLLQIYEIDPLYKDDLNNIKSLTEKLTVALAKLVEPSNEADEVIDKSEEINLFMENLDITTKQLLATLKKNPELEMLLEEVAGNKESKLNGFEDLNLKLLKSIIRARKYWENLRK